MSLKGDSWEGYLKIPFDEQFKDLCEIKCTQYSFDHRYWTNMDKLWSALGGSYKQQKQNRPFHIDICPYATNQSWGKLKASQQIELFLSSLLLFEERLASLHPDIIFF